MVSIHAPAWGATRMWNRRVKEDYVSIHAPAWGATRDYFTTARPWPQFQSTHPRGVRPAWSPRSCGSAGFNPRTRVGCDSSPSKKFPAGRVSIHAPAWGATKKLLAKIKSFLVSIHAPAWGATRKAHCQEGKTVVSIHAPAWGATHPKCPNSDRSLGFNPRTRVGCDGECVTHMLKKHKFQSTHPRGVRHQQMT